jgi:hypothetical protein
LQGNAVLYNANFVSLRQSLPFAIHRIDDDKYCVCFSLEALNEIFAALAELVRVKEYSQVLELAGSKVVECFPNVTSASS